MTEALVSRPRKVVPTVSLSDLAHGIIAEHVQVELAARQGLKHAIRAGQLLVEAKSQVAHGEWVCWVKSNCHLSVRTAQVYMRLANSQVHANTQRSALLTIGAAMKEMKERATISPGLYEEGSEERGELDAIAEAIGRSAQDLMRAANRMSQARPPNLDSFPRFISILELAIEAVVNWERYCRDNDQQPRKYEGYTFPGSSNHQTVLPLKDSLLVIESDGDNRFFLSRVGHAFTDKPSLAESWGVIDLKQTEATLTKMGAPRGEHWFSLRRNIRPLAMMPTEELDRRLHEYALNSTKLAALPAPFSAFQVRLRQAFNVGW